MFVIMSPLSKQGVQTFYEHCKDLGLESRILRIYIDLQNIAVGKYYNSNILEIYTKLTEREVVSMVVYEILKFVSDKINLFRNVFNHNEIYFYLYTDKQRNKLNEYFIETWKENRRKSWEYLREHKIEEYESQQWFSQVFSKSVDIACKILSTSLHSYPVILKYVDSDFLPYVFILYDKLCNVDSTHLIVSNDHDYIHILSEFPNVFRYFFLTKNKGVTVENHYTIFKRLKNKFPQKTLDVYDHQFIAKFYQLFHAFLGDPGDGFGPIKPKYGIVRFLKDVKKEISLDNDINDIRKKVLTKSLNLNLSDTELDMLVQRLLVVDFRFFSEHLLKDFVPFEKLMYVEDTKQYFQSLERKHILESNANILRDSMFNKNILQRHDINSILKDLNVKNPDYISQSLWY